MTKGTKFPFERQWQFFGTAYYLLLVSFLNGCAGFTLLLLLTEYYYIVLAYYAWLIYDYNTCNTGGRSIEWIRAKGLMKKLAKDYFSMKLIKTVELDPNRNYMCGSHPHGYLCLTAFCNIANDVNDFGQLFPGITTHLLSFFLMFHLPIYREYLLAIGNCSTTKSSIEYLLTKNGTGNAVVNVVGGAAEISYTRPYHMILVLKERKGFVKLAIKCGADLLPILHFGEGEIYSPAWKPQIYFIERVELAFKWIFGFRPALYAAYNFFMNVILVGMPKRTPINTVVGRPVTVIKDENPSQELIDEYHSKYIEAVKLLFEESKMKLGPEYHKAKITII